jgi:hypothetical protein
MNLASPSFTWMTIHVLYEKPDRSEWSSRRGVSIGESFVVMVSCLSDGHSKPQLEPSSPRARWHYLGGSSVGLSRLYQHSFADLWASAVPKTRRYFSLFGRPYNNPDGASDIEDIRRSVRILKSFQEPWQHNPICRLLDWLDQAASGCILFQCTLWVIYREEWIIFIFHLLFHPKCVKQQPSNQLRLSLFSENVVGTHSIEVDGISTLDVR